MWIDQLRKSCQWHYLSDNCYNACHKIKKSLIVLRCYLHVQLFYLFMCFLLLMICNGHYYNCAVSRIRIELHPTCEQYNNCPSNRWCWYERSTMLHITPSFWRKFDLDLLKKIDDLFTWAIHPINFKEPKPISPN